MISADTFQVLFRPGRTDCFARMKGTKAISIKEPLTTDVLQQHLAGKERIAVYPLTSEGRTWLGFLDLDSGVTPVLDLVALAKKWGVLLAVERSKSKGFHLWIFFSESVPAIKVRALLIALLRQTGWHDHKIQVFPLQDHPGQDGFGNPMYLPWHGLSVQEGRCLFLNLAKDQWPPYKNQAEYLQKRPQLSAADLDKILRRQKIVAFTQGDPGSSPTKTSVSSPRQGGFEFPPCFAQIYETGTTEPGRANWAHGLARQFNNRGLPEEATLSLLMEWNQKNRPEPLPASEIRDGVRSAYAKGYTSLMCEQLDGSRAICGDRCPALKKDHSPVTKERPSPVSVLASDIVPGTVKWLWDGRIPRGMVTMLCGDPGTAKSFLLIDILCRVTAGASWPGGGQAPHGSVIFLTAEDVLDVTIRPRIDSQEGDPSRFHIFQGVGIKAGEPPEHFSLQDHLQVLEGFITETGAIAVGIDPMSAYLGDLDSHRDAAVRGILAPVTALVERTGVSFIGIMHLSKKEQRQVIYRPQASIAFMAAPRAVFAVMRDTDDRDLRKFFALKINIAPEPPGLAFRIPHTFQGVSKVEWEPGEYNIPPEELLATSDRDRPDRESAVEFLTELLRHGPVPSKQAVKEGEDNGISERTLRRARTEQGIEARKHGFNPTVWYWVPRGYPWEEFDPATFDPTEGGEHPQGVQWQPSETGPVMETTLMKREVAIEEPPEPES